MVRLEVLIRGLPSFGAIGMVSKERPEKWYIDSTRFHGPNMVSCEIVTRIKWTPLIRSYLLSANMDHLPDLKEALNDFLGRDNIVVGT